MDKKKKEIDSDVKKDILESILTGELYYSKIPNPTLQKIDPTSEIWEELKKECNKIIWDYNFLSNSGKKREIKEINRKIKKLRKGSEKIEKIDHKGK